MLKKHLLEALAAFPDDAHIAIGETATLFVPLIVQVCGRSREATALYCGRQPGHGGRCFSRAKQVVFDPDDKAPASALLTCDTRDTVGLWAPGTYQNNCVACGCAFVVDRRAMHCAPCAYAKLRKDNAEASKLFTDKT